MNQSPFMNRSGLAGVNQLFRVTEGHVMGSWDNRLWLVFMCKGPEARQL